MTYFQSWISHAHKENVHACMGQDGKLITHDRHSERVNSDNRLYWIARKKPAPKPIMNLATVNIIQFVEMILITFEAMSIRIEASIGGFLP